MAALALIFVIWCCFSLCFIVCCNVATSYVGLLGSLGLPCMLHLCVCILVLELCGFLLLFSFSLREFFGCFCKFVKHFTLLHCMEKSSVNIDKMWLVDCFQIDINHTYVVSFLKKYFFSLCGSVRFFLYIYARRLAYLRSNKSCLCFSKPAVLLSVCICVCVLLLLAEVLLQCLSIDRIK